MFAPYYQPYYGSAYAYQPYQAPTYPRMPYYAPQESSAGGVSAVLDYDLRTMTKFVLGIAFRYFRREDDANAEFENAVYSVLNATRLPSVSLFLALNYLHKRLSNLPAVEGNSDDVIYTTLMTSLVLANKFNDDNTFTNRSWASATSLDIQLINKLEREWLNIFGWNLYDDKFALYDKYVESYSKYVEDTIRRAYERKVLQSHSVAPATPVRQRQTNYLASPAVSEHEFSPASDCWEKPRRLQFSSQYACNRSGSTQRNPFCGCEYCGASNWNYPVY